MSLIFSLVQLELGYDLLVKKKIIDSQKAKVKQKQSFCMPSERRKYVQLRQSMRICTVHKIRKQF